MHKCLSLKNESREFVVFPQQSALLKIILQLQKMDTKRQEKGTDFHKTLSQTFQAKNLFCYRNHITKNYQCYFCEFYDHAYSLQSHNYHILNYSWKQILVTFHFIKDELYGPFRNLSSKLKKVISRIQFAFLPEAK